MRAHAEPLSATNLCTEMCLLSGSLQCVNGSPSMVMHQTTIRNVVSDVNIEMHDPCDCSGLNDACDCSASGSTTSEEPSNAASLTRNGMEGCHLFPEKRQGTPRESAF
eukprot:6491495-Amphidinium_carterae.3